MSSLFWFSLIASVSLLVLAWLYWRLERMRTANVILVLSKEQSDEPLAFPKEFAAAVAEIYARKESGGGAAATELDDVG